MDLPELTDKEASNLIQYMVDKNFILAKHNVRSFLKLNYDEIYKHLCDISANAALSLDLIRDIIDTCEYSALFNIKQFGEDLASYREEHQKYPPLNENFIKFSHSYLAHLTPKNFLYSVVMATEIANELRRIREQDSN